MGIFGGAQKGPSQTEIIAAQEAARKAEQQKLAEQQALADASAEKQAQSAAQKAEGRRQAFASGIVQDENSQRKRFLSGR